MENKVFDLVNFSNLNNNLVLEASAGTGKTYTITEIVSKLVNSGIDLKKMLIVTYTEKATGELKGRIRDRILKEHSNDKKIINDLNNINIFTIHSFCQNTISEFGLEANQPLDLNVIDEKAKLSVFFDEYIRKDPILSEATKLNVIGFAIKDLFIETALKYYLNSNGELENSIISIDVDNEIEILFNKYGDQLYNDNNNLLRFDSLVKTLPKFREYYEKLREKTDYKFRLLERYIEEYDYKNNSFSVISFKGELAELGDEFVESYNFLCSEKGRVIKGTNFEEILENYDSRYPGVLKHYNRLLNSEYAICNIFATNIMEKTMADGKKFKVETKLDLYKFFGIEKDNEAKDKETEESETEESDLFNIIKYYEELCKKLVEARKNPCLFILLEYIGDFYLKWQNEKKIRKEQTFNDMLRIVRENILRGNPVFKKKLKEKYDIAIIDEFQDTNQIQFDVFKSIFMEDNEHRIIVVGDPKQSIYSFQGADLNVYMKAKEEIVTNGGELFSLSTNYRSTKNMITSCNKFFDNTNRYFTGIDFSHSLSPIDNKRNVKYKGKETKAFWIGMLQEEEKEEQDDEENKDDKRERIKPEIKYARMAVKQIIDFCSKGNGSKTNLIITEKSGNERNVSFSDFTILARTRSEMEPIIRELKKCGIPYIRYKDTGLFSSNECYNWISILEAINAIDFTGRNRCLFKRALFTKFFDKSLEEINSDYYNHDDNKEMALLLKWKELANNKKWEDLIESILEDSNILNRLNELDKLQSLSLYKQIGDYCITYLYNNHNLDELIIDLSNSSIGDSDDEDSNTVEIATDFDAVKIMTIHASKGLQFPIVISVAGFKDFNRLPKTYICHKEEEDNNHRKITLYFKNSEKDTLEEWERLMYVNYTRAEYLLLLPLYEKNKVIDNDDLRTDYKSYLSIQTQRYMENEDNLDDYNVISYEENDYYLLKKQVKKILGESSYDEEAKNTQLDLIKGIIKKSPSLASYKHSYSELSHGAKEEIIGDDEERNLEGEMQEGLSKYDKIGIQVNSKVDNTINPIAIPINFPKGSKIGEALHEIFELLDYTTKENLDNIIHNCLSKQKIKLDDDRLNYIKEIVNNVLGSNLVEIIGSKQTNNCFKLCSIHNNDKKCEIEFNYNKENEHFKNYFNGFIDLLFRRGEIYSIVDWKSDSLNEDNFISYSDNAELKKHTDNSYSIQRVLYSYTLIKWLKCAKYKNLSNEEIFNQHFGGVYYIYLRGCNKDTGNGIYQHTWNSYSELEKSYKEIMKLIGGK